MREVALRVLITGGAGYIGSVSARVLLDAGHEVVVLDTLERGHEQAVDPRALLLRADVSDAEALAEALAVCDAVLHCAGYIEVAESQRDCGRYFDNNVARPLTLLRAMVGFGIESIVFSSTAAVYGEPEAVPIMEDGPLRPVNAYGASKLMFEQQLEWFAANHGLRPMRLRYFNVAGAHPDGSLGEAHDPETHIIPRVLRAMASGERRFEVFGDDYPTRDGTCVRDYLHVVDLARAHLMALEALGEGTEGSVYNLGNGQGYTNLEVVRKCAEVTGREVEVVIGPRRAGDPAVLLAGSRRVEEGLGWRPCHPELTDMVRDAWRWHAGHPSGFEGPSPP